MVFSSLFFLFIFLPLNILLYYSVKNRNFRNYILILFSLIFYAWGEPIWVSLLIFSALVDYCNGLFIERFRNKPIARLGVVSSVVINLALLISFKYADFIIENVNVLFNTSFKKPGFGLPIGISFYTFQTISYSIDVYRNEVKAQRSFLNFLMFVSLFHQLVAGPIVRYSHIANEIDTRKFSWEDMYEGINRFCRGLFKKVFVANIAGELAKQYLDADVSTITVGAGWYGLLMFTIQIYYDFSGYSDMAIGLGRMFGFHYRENFNYPYIAKSITDFWRRWHMSLSSFFRDYVYIPLGGNKRNQIFNIAVVWALTGMWHGANWNFIWWGIYFGFIIILEKLFILKLLGKIPIFLQHFYSLFLVVIGWALFYFTDMNNLWLFLQLIFGQLNNEWWDFEIQNAVLANIYWFIFAIIFSMPAFPAIKKLISEKWKRQTSWNYLQIAFNIVFLIVSVALLVGNSYNPFLYFRF